MNSWSRDGRVGRAAVEPARRLRRNRIVQVSFCTCGVLRDVGRRAARRALHARADRGRLRGHGGGRRAVPARHAAHAAAVARRLLEGGRLLAHLYGRGRDGARRGAGRRLLLLGVRGDEAGAQADERRAGAPDPALVRRELRRGGGVPRARADGGRDAADADGAVRVVQRGGGEDRRRERRDDLLHRLLDDGRARDPVLLHPVPDVRGAEEVLADGAGQRHDGGAGRGVRLARRRDLVRRHHAARRGEDADDDRRQNRGRAALLGARRYAARTL